MSWSHKQAFFWKSATGTLAKCRELADQRGAEYDTHRDSFMEAPVIFLEQVDKRHWATPTDRRVATRLAVLADVKIQRILSGQAKEDSYLDLINYVAALTGLLFPDEEKEPVPCGLGAMATACINAMEKDATWTEVKGNPFLASTADLDCLDNYGQTSVSEFTRLSGEYTDK